MLFQVSVVKGPSKCEELNSRLKSVEQARVLAREQCARLAAYVAAKLY